MRHKYMFSSSSFISKPTSLTENDNAPNLFTFFHVRKLKADVLITQLLNFSLRIYRDFIANLLQNTFPEPCIAIHTRICENNQRDAHFYSH